VAPDESPQPFDTLPPGTELGRYRIVRLMGAGGMGAVYEATHRDLKKRVAIKTLHPSVAAMPAARARFLREGEATSRINHPNVVDVTDVGTDNGITFLVMEFLEGQDLSVMLEQSGALPIAAAVDIVLAAVGAIAVAHEEGVIHRDLKPGNVFLARTRHGSPRPVVLDFGISKLSAGSEGTLGLTGTGAAMGTPYYMAPEQVRSAAGVDGRSDQYALGAILYECLTGQRAHQGETIYEVIRSVGEGTFLPPRARRPDIPVALEQTVLRAMRLDPAQRFASVQEFGRALLPFASPSVRDQFAPAMGVAGGGATGAAIGTPPTATSPITPWARSGASGPLPSTPPPPAVTTFSQSAAQIGSPAARRPGILIGGIVLVAAGAAAAFVFLSDKNKPAGGPAPAVPATVEVVKPAAPAPPSYRVKVDAIPATAHLELDGKTVKVGHIDEPLAVDGAEHTLTVSAPEFVTTTLKFRDRPPVAQVTLQHVAVAKLAAPTAAEETKVRPAHATARPHDRKKHAAASSAAPAAPARGPNNAAIIE
jgi:tRNA A-37 threonylcarbamoyl transferase component Bud32